MVFAFTCAYCGPVRVVPTADVRARPVPPSHWCPRCGASVVAAVEHTDETPSSAG